jgi:nifR3 family TIM-barrel protein
MAGLTNGPYRKVAAEAGCRAFWTEMVTAEGLIRGKRDILRILPESDEPGPVAVQIFGSNPDSLAEAAACLEGFRADVLDINMACPVKKVVRTGAGAALMRDPERVGRIVGGVVRRTTRPVTVKIRSGWDKSEVNALEVGRRAVEGGAAAVVIHPRTRAQGFSGSADYSLASLLVENLAVPVIVSGDVSSGEEAARAFRESGAASVMIGRAAVGNPWIFHQVQHYLENGVEPPPPAPGEKLEMISRHLSLMVEKYGEKRGIFLFRGQLLGYMRGQPGAARWRREVLLEMDPDRLREKIEAFVRGWE